MNIDNTFDIQTQILNKLLQEESLLEALNIKDTNNIELVNKKINLQEINLELFDVKNMPCVSIYFPNVEPSNNYLVNTALLRIESYTINRISAKKIIGVIRKVLKYHFDLYLIAEGEQPSDIKNLYKYKLEYITKTWS